jgi:hypothetical protein
VLAEIAAENRVAAPLGVMPFCNPMRLPMFVSCVPSVLSGAQLLVEANTQLEALPMVLPKTFWHSATQLVTLVTIIHDKNGEKVHTINHGIPIRSLKVC